MPVFSLYCPKILIWCPLSGITFPDRLIFLPLMKQIILILKESSTMRTSLSALLEELHFLDSPSATLQLESVPGSAKKPCQGKTQELMKS